MPIYQVLIAFAKWWNRIPSRKYSSTETGPCFGCPQTRSSLRQLNGFDLCVANIQVQTQDPVVMPRNHILVDFAQNGGIELCLERKLNQARPSCQKTTMNVSVV